jgi:GMP synthase-like glutamine amidotransferase
MEQRRALVIAHESDGPGGQVAVRLAQRGYQIHTHLVTDDYDQPNRAAPFPNFNDFDLVAVMGSIRSLTDKAAIDSWVHDEIARLAEAHQQGTPILGVCFGGQLLAEALGGTTEQSPVTEIGWFELEDGPDHRNPAGPGPWMEWHHDRFVPPPEATVLAQTDSAIQLFSLGRSVGTQFHPEVDVDHINGWLSFAPDDYLDANGVDRADILADIERHEARNIEQCHAFVDWFLDDIVNGDRPTPEDQARA